MRLTSWTFLVPLWFSIQYVFFSFSFFLFFLFVFSFFFFHLPTELRISYLVQLHFHSWSMYKIDFFLSFSLYACFITIVTNYNMQKVRLWDILKGLWWLWISANITKILLYSSFTINFHFLSACQDDIFPNFAGV